MRCWLKMQMQARRSNTTSSGRSYRVLRHEPCSGSCRKKEARKSFHGYVERLARTGHKTAAARAHTGALPPCSQRFRQIRGLFGPTATDPKELRVGGIWRVDGEMSYRHLRRIQLPAGAALCDSDDISYAGLHPKLIWERSMTLGRGDDRCDFCMKIIK